MSKKFKIGNAEVKWEKWELPEDYKFANIIKCCEPKIDFNTNTIVDKILSTRAKKVDKEVIRLLKNIGEENGINELILIDESKVLNMIKSLKALEIIKEKEVDIAWVKRHSPTLEDYNKAWCVGAKDLTQEEYDLLKEVLL